MIISGALITLLLISFSGFALYGMAYNNMAIVIWLVCIITAVIQIVTGFDGFVSFIDCDGVANYEIFHDVYDDHHAFIFNHTGAVSCWCTCK